MFEHVRSGCSLLHSERSLNDETQFDMFAILLDHLVLDDRRDFSKLVKSDKAANAASRRAYG